MVMQTGKFIVSLDFELMWGVRDIVTVQSYGINIKGVHQALPVMLDYFNKFNIHGTFAIVGFLFCRNKKELLEKLPHLWPKYLEPSLSPYGNYITNNVANDIEGDPYHFAHPLIQRIKDNPYQEIATHTYSHFYCLEQGQTLDDFEDDLKAAIAIAAQTGIKITSIIFPRNQVNPIYLPVCAKNGITAFRSTENSWIYTARTNNNESWLRRFLRLLDTYINISGHHCYSDDYLKKDILINIPASRFLRPYSPWLGFLDSLKLSRIKNSMTYAAKNGLLYHLWWHPHNFGINQQKNFSSLEKILEHYTFLNKKYGFTSYTMAELSEKLSDKR